MALQVQENKCNMECLFVFFFSESTMTHTYLFQFEYIAKKYVKHEAMVTEWATHRADLYSRRKKRQKILDMN